MLFLIRGVVCDVVRGVPFVLVFASLALFKFVCVFKHVLAFVCMCVLKGVWMGVESRACEIKGVRSKV